MTGQLLSFKMESCCQDKQDRDVDCLVIDPDPVGIVGEYIRCGNPFWIDDDNEVAQNDDLISHYFNFMSEIDLTVDDNLVAVGYDALSEARETVRLIFWAMSGIVREKSRLTGEMKVFYDESAAEKMRGFFGHLLNPEVAGQSLEQVQKMRFSEASAVIEMVSASNSLLQQAQKAQQES